jgi:hypothetical protein
MMSFRRLGGLLTLLLFVQPEPVVVSTVVALSASTIAGCGGGSCSSCCECSYVCTDMGDVHRLTAGKGECLDCTAMCREYYRTSGWCEGDYEPSRVEASACVPETPAQ